MPRSCGSPRKLGTGRQLLGRQAKGASPPRWIRSCICSHHACCSCSGRGSTPASQAAVWHSWRCWWACTPAGLRCCGPLGRCCSSGPRAHSSPSTRRSTTSIPSSRLGGPHTCSATATSAPVRAARPSQRARPSRSSELSTSQRWPLQRPSCWRPALSPGPRLCRTSAHAGRLCLCCWSPPPRILPQQWPPGCTAWCGPLCHAHVCPGVHPARCPHASVCIQRRPGLQRVSG